MFLSWLEFKENYYRISDWGKSKTRHNYHQKELSHHKRIKERRKKKGYK